jgi:hypothetical protein
MAGEEQQKAKQYLATLGAMSWDELAVARATNPDSLYATVADIEMKRRVAEAQVQAAQAQRDATFPLQLTGWATVILALATLALAIVTYLHGP